MVTDGEESLHAAGAPLLRWVPAGQRDGGQSRPQGRQVRPRSPGHIRERADAPAAGSGPVLIHSLTSLEPLLNARHHDDLRELCIQGVRGVMGVIKRREDYDDPEGEETAAKDPSRAAEREHTG